jgi:hypothetical protein
MSVRARKLAARHKMPSLDPDEEDEDMERQGLRIVSSVKNRKVLRGLGHRCSL